MMKWLWLLLMVPSLCQAATTYHTSAGSGADAARGTPDAPFRTIGRGLRALASGDTLVIGAGTYTEGLDNAVPAGREGAPTIIMGADGAWPVLQPTGGHGGVVSFSGRERSYITVTGLVLDARHEMSGVALTWPGAHPSERGGANHISIINCEIMRAQNNGIIANIGAHSNVFRSLRIHDNGTNDFDHGVYIKAEDNVIEQSDIFRNAGWGVHVYWSETHLTPVHRATVRNNRIYDNGQTGRGAGILLSSGAGHMAYNNLIWGNPDGIQVKGHHPVDAKVLHNTVVSNVGPGIYVGEDARGTQVINNIFFANGSAPVISGTGTRAERNLLIDPMFVDGALRDYRIRVGSPAIDEAFMSFVTNDYLGVGRPVGPAPDLGALEFCTGVCPLMPPPDLGGPFGPGPPDMPYGPLPPPWNLRIVTR